MNLTFRSPEPSDLKALLNHINSASAEHTFIRKQGEQLTKEDEQKFLDSTLKDIESKKAVMLLAFDGETLVGTADVRLGFGAEEHIGLFGIIVHKDHRGKGIGTELTKQTIKEATKHLPTLEIVNLGVFSDNYRAIHIYQKFGFKEYGELPNGVIRNGKHYNQLFMYLDV